MKYSTSESKALLFRVLILCRRPYYYWHGQQFDAMTTGTDGTVFIGESERRSYLFFFIPYNSDNQLLKNYGNQ
jgi:hypothetical protein